jgi:3'-phosphoadenosine 5'-phosphosulfate sulfotransferase (PAPS reductase)/FAD synthetase
MLDGQIDLFDITDCQDSSVLTVTEEVDYGEVDLLSYDFYIVAMSGGKDSIACLLYLLKNGVPPEKIELWHHCVDGKDNPDPLMDWPVTESYCRKLAEAFNIPLYFSWKEGGFSAEMLRDNELTKPTWFETPEGTFKKGGTTGKLGTRRMFPQLAASLSQRWCSAYLKVDPASKAITGQKRFNHKRTLFVTGERAQESTARSRYHTFEPHRTDRRNGRSGRLVDQIRPVHAWPEEDVWEIIKEYKVRPHPAYQMGWGRLSCMTCIFASGSQWASVKKIDPRRFDRIAAYEKEFGKTIHRKKSVEEQIEGKAPYAEITPELIDVAMSLEYTLPIFMENWELPAGAFGESAGPT